MLGSASSLFAECYKSKNIEESEIFFKKVISEYQYIGYNYLDSSWSQSDEIENLLKKNFNMENITNWSVGKYHLKSIGKKRKIQ